MAMPEFPKYIFIDDSTIARKNYPNVVRSDMENGPVRTRPINSVPLYSLEFEVSINKTKFSDFRQWYHNELIRGALWFTMKEPLVGNLIRARFADTEIEWLKTGNLMRSTFTLEAYDEL